MYDHSKQIYNYIARSAWPFARSAWPFARSAGREVGGSRGQRRSAWRVPMTTW